MIIQLILLAVFCFFAVKIKLLNKLFIIAKNLFIKTKDVKNKFVKLKTDTKLCEKRIKDHKKMRKTDFLTNDEV